LVSVFPLSFLPDEKSVFPSIGAIRVLFTYLFSFGLEELIGTLSLKFYGIAIGGIFFESQSQFWITYLLFILSDLITILLYLFNPPSFGWAREGFIDQTIISQFP
jgi:hypothetical protein